MRRHGETQWSDPASTRTGGARLRSAVELTALGLLCAVAIGWQTEGFRRTKSITVDEAFYRSAGADTVSQGTLSPDLPRHGVAPLPILLTWVPAAVLEAFPSEAARVPKRDQAFEPPWDGVWRARVLQAVLVGVPLACLVGVWLWRLHGFSAALLGASMMSFSPTLLAHSAVATTDATLAWFALATLASLSLLSRGLTVGRFFGSAILCGMAISAKYSGVFLIPLAGLALLGVPRPPHAASLPDLQSRPGRRAMDVGLLWGGYIWIAATVCWAHHGFMMLPLSSAANFPAHRFEQDWTAWHHTELPAPLVGMYFQYLHNGSGHAAFLGGQTSMTGWWSYFPLAFLFKSTPAELLLAGVVAWAAWQFASSAWSTFRGKSARFTDALRDTESSLSIDRVLWWTALGVYGLMIMNVRVQIGHRYLLPIYPLLCLVATDWLSRWWSGHRARAAVMLVVLISLQVISAARIAPHYLAYFSPLAGGPRHGHRWLSDSNIDWGQDLPQLRDKIAQRGYSRVLLCYFGFALPHEYGLDIDLADTAPDTRLSDYDCLAVSVMELHEVRHTLEDDIFRRLRRVPPTDRAGYSIFLYDLRDDRIRRHVDLDQPVASLRRVRRS
jgi:hypothetical protein